MNLFIWINAHLTPQSTLMIPMVDIRAVLHSIVRGPFDEQRRIVGYLDGLQAKVNALGELQSASGEELSALMPSVLDKAFKGEL